MESDLYTLLVALCPRVSPDFADVGTARPYVTYQHIGGPPLRYVDNTPVPQRHSQVQINVWSDTKAAALLLARQIEEALCASPAFNVTVDGEPVGDAEPEFKRYGTLQDFSILAAR